MPGENNNPEQALKDQKKALEEQKVRALAEQKQALDEEKAKALEEQKQAGFDFGPAAETAKPRTCKSGKWRATKDSTYHGKFVKEGTIVSAEEMDNPHFAEYMDAKKEPK